MFGTLFHVALYQLMFNIFVGLYNVLPGHDVGIVIFIITLAVRALVYPLTSASIKAQRSLQDMQPKLEAIKQQFSNGNQAQAQATMEVYKNNKVNPLTSCLPMLVQLPILIALYLVLRDGLASKDIAASLYSFVHNPGTINPISLGIFSLAKPSIVLSVLAGAAQFWQARSLVRKSPPKVAGSGAKDEDMMAMMNKQMLYVMPVLTAIIGLRLPAGLTLYWCVSTGLMALQQQLLAKKSTAIPPSNPSAPIIEGQIVT